MGPQKTEGITIKRTDYSETSQIVTFYTRDYGKVRTIARGAKRQKNQFHGPLDLLTHHRIIFLMKPFGLNVLTDCTLLDGFSFIRKDFNKMQRAIYVAKFLNELTPWHSRNTTLFDLSLKVFKDINTIHLTLSSNDNLDELTLFSFQSRALRSMGYMPHTSYCAYCERKVSPVDKGVIFSARYGGALCPKCKDNDQHTIPTSLGVLALFSSLSNGRVSHLERLRVPTNMRQDLSRLLGYYVSSIAGRELKTLKTQ